MGARLRMKVLLKKCWCTVCRLCWRRWMFRSIDAMPVTCFLFSLLTSACLGNCKVQVIGKYSNRILMCLAGVEMLSGARRWTAMKGILPLPFVATVYVANVGAFLVNDNPTERWWWQTWNWKLSHKEHELTLLSPLSMQPSNTHLYYYFPTPHLFGYLNVARITVSTILSASGWKQSLLLSPPELNSFSLLLV